MISRIFTGAALTGLLLASGCGGGGTSPSGGGITPIIGGGTVPGTTSTARGSATVHFLVPIPHGAGASTASSTRQPKYVSPGSSGIQVLLGDGSLYNASVAGILTVPAPGNAGGQQFIIGTQATPSAIPASATSGTFALPAGLPGYVSGASASYTYTLSSTAGYYNFSLSITGLAALTGSGGANGNLVIGVVLSDIGTAGNPVLSEGSGTVITAAAGIPATNYTVALKPVLSKAYLFGPGAAILVGVAPAVTSEAFPFTAYAADERGYAIPYVSAATSTFANGTFSLAQYQSAGLTSTGLTSGFSYYDTGGAVTAGTASPSNTSLNPSKWSNNGQLVASTDTLTAATTPGATSAAVTLTGANNPLLVGTQVLIGVDTVTVTASSTPTGAGPFAQLITFSPALTQYYLAAAPVTITSTLPAGAAGNTAGWTTPGNAIPNLAFAQTAGTPSIAGPTAYSAGQSAVVSASVPNTYGVVVVGNFTASTAPVVGYAYTPGVNYPAAATGVIISAPSTFVVPPGLGVTVSGAKRQQ